MKKKQDNKLKNRASHQEKLTASLLSKGGLQRVKVQIVQQKEHLKQTVKQYHKHHFHQSFQNLLIIRPIMFGLFLLAAAWVGLGYAILNFIEIPYDGKVVFVPETTSRIAGQAGILQQHYKIAGEQVVQDTPLLSLYFSNLNHLSKKTADRLAEINLIISRLEVQTAGELKWNLPVNMQQRALQNVEFSQFLLRQHEEFDAYYDRLDDYARQIYQRKERLVKRIGNLESELNQYRQNLRNINRRLATVGVAQQKKLRQERGYLNRDIGAAKILHADLTGALVRITPRLQRIIDSRSDTIKPDLQKAYETRALLYQKLGINNANAPLIIRAARDARVGELLNISAGDIFAKNAVLYRLLPASNQTTNIVMRVSFSKLAHEKLSADIGRICLNDANGEYQCFQPTFVRTERHANAPAWGEYQRLYRLDLKPLFAELHRLPEQGEAIIFYTGQTGTQRFGNFSELFSHRSPLILPIGSVIYSRDWQSAITTANQFLLDLFQRPKGLLSLLQKNDGLRN